MHIYISKTNAHVKNFFLIFSSILKYWPKEKEWMWKEEKKIYKQQIFIALKQKQRTNYFSSSNTRLLVVPIKTLVQSKRWTIITQISNTGKTGEWERQSIYHSEMCISCPRVHLFTASCSNKFIKLMKIQLK